MSYGLDHAILLFCGILVAWLTTVGLPRTRAALFAVILFGLIVPLPRFTIFDIVIAAFGTLSVTTLAHTVMAALSRYGIVMPDASRAEYATGMALLAGSASALYAASFGFNGIDLYSLGYDQRIFVLLAAPLWLFAIWQRWLWFVVTIPLLAVAIRLQALPSVNWWDYVVDPVYWAVAIGKLVLLPWLFPRPAPG